ncbi:MAG: hypothetical protein KAG96_04530 [Ichthyobacteriaceae bacterium]|nr:hypothetical protein [Ichthyobacteriaceae bacterium]
MRKFLLLAFLVPTILSAQPVNPNHGNNGNGNGGGGGNNGNGNGNGNCNGNGNGNNGNGNGNCGNHHADINGNLPITLLLLSGVGLVAFKNR